MAVLCLPETARRSTLADTVDLLFGFRRVLSNVLARSGLCIKVPEEQRTIGPSDGSFPGQGVAPNATPDRGSLAGVPAGLGWAIVRMR